jgi:hypothetical protein
MKRLALLAFMGIVGTISGCSKNTGENATNTSPSVVQAAAPVSAAGNVNPSDALPTEASQALAFINRSIVASDCVLRNGSTWTICSRNGALSIVGNKLVMNQDFEEDYANGSVKNSHETTTVAISDLNADTLKVVDNDFEGATDEIHIDCKSGNKCESSIETSSNEGPKNFSGNRFILSNFSRKDVNEVASYFRRLLALQQGGSATAIERDPTEEEAVAFIETHVARTVNMRQGITLVHRRITVEGNELVETQDLLQYGRPAGYLAVRVNLKDLDELIVSDDSGVGLVCKPSSEGTAQNCFQASTGQSSMDHNLMGVSNHEEFIKMLKRLIVLHQ